MKKKNSYLVLLGLFVLLGLNIDDVEALEVRTTHDVPLVNQLSQTKMINTWDQTGNYYYDSQGNTVKGFQTINNKKYYFNEKGIKQVGFISINQQLYYSYDNGLVQNGFFQTGNSLYYFDKEGKAARGLCAINGDSYYFNSNYVAETGFKNLNNNLYYFDSTTKKMVKNKWIEDSSYKYYFDSYGKAVSDIITIGEYTYYFDKNHRMYTAGWKFRNGETLFFNRVTGKLYRDQWYIEGGNKYYIKGNGARATGLQEIDGKKYYFNGAGVLQIGFLNIDNKLYYSYTNGFIENSWFQTKGKWYYFQNDGSAALDMTSIGEYTYYFDKNYQMYTDGWKSKGSAMYFFNKVTGKLYSNQWYEEKGNTYYIQENGTRATGLVNIENSIYYFKSDGTKQIGFIEAGGNLYYSYAKGIVQNKWFETAGKRYYFGYKGRAATDLTTIGNSTYYFDANHVMYKGFKTINNNLYLFDKVSGQMYKNAVYTDTSGTYYFDKNGIVSTKPGWVDINGQKYLFNSNNQIVTGAKKLIIDVSEWNEITDWNKVKASGVDGVILRIGFGYDTTNVTNQMDKKFIENVRELERVGLPYGVYLFSYAKNEEDALLEAQYTLDCLKYANARPTLPVYYDLESSDYVGDIDKSVYTKMAIAFCEKIKQAGYDTGIYANLNYFENKLNDSSLDKYTKWIAQYNQNNGQANHCDYEKQYKMWQYTSVGKVDGIIGNVDLSAMY